MAFYSAPANLLKNLGVRSVKHHRAIRGVHQVSSRLLANASILHEDKQKCSVINDREYTHACS